MALDMDLPSPTQGLLEWWEEGGESGERGLSGEGGCLEVTPGDKTKAAVGRDWGQTDHSDAVLNQLRCMFPFVQASTRVFETRMLRPASLTNTFTTTSNSPRLSDTVVQNNQWTGKERERKENKVKKGNEKVLWSKTSMDRIYYYYSNTFYHSGGPFSGRGCQLGQNRCKAGSLYHVDSCLIGVELWPSNAFQLGSQVCLWNIRQLCDPASYAHLPGKTFYSICESKKDVPGPSLFL